MFITTPSRYKKIIIGLSALFFAALLVAEAFKVEIIPINYRQASELIPNIQPLLVEGGTVSGFNNQLIVKTTPSNLAEIKRIIAQLDKRPRQLLITVRQNDKGMIFEEEYGVSGSVGNDNIKITTTDGYHQDKVKIKAKRHHTDSYDKGTQQVKTLEGRPAFIRLSQDVPIVTHIHPEHHSSESFVPGIEYKTLSQGFNVTARVSGEQVFLEIETVSERESRLGGGKFDSQSTATTTAGKLGQWIPLSGVDIDSSQRSSGYTHRTLRRDSQQLNVSVKVTIID